MAGDKAFAAGVAEMDEGAITPYCETNLKEKFRSKGLLQSEVLSGLLGTPSIWKVEWVERSNW